MNLLPADWPAPATIVAGVSCRAGGVSSGVYADNNLALHVGDNAGHVLENRRRLDASLPGDKRWQWLDQVHGVAVAEAACDRIIQADAAYSNRPGIVCAVLTADCLPVLLCDSRGLEVAAVHAGWRGLCHGVIENTVARFVAGPGELLAWLGPAIGPAHFEVGEEVRQAFAAQPAGPASMAAFVPAGSPGKYRADLYQLARIRLQALGVRQVSGGGLCTFADRRRFYSYRRDGVTGRMASFVYRTA
ncbi:MAG TPA: peptidoglycan editing factor PgeF [Pseudomonadales bacterium]